MLADRFFFFFCTMRHLTIRKRKELVYQSVTDETPFIIKPNSDFCGDLGLAKRHRWVPLSDRCSFLHIIDIITETLCDCSSDGDEKKWLLLV